MKRMLPVALAAAALGLLCVGSQLTPSSSSGFSASAENLTNTAGTAQYFTCASALAASGGTADKPTATFLYALSEGAASSTATDSSLNNAGSTVTGGNTGSYLGEMTTSTTTPMPCRRDATLRAYVLDGTTAYVSSPNVATSDTLTEEVWFKTSTAAGKLIGFGDTAGTATTFDRQLYIGSTGKVYFGVAPGGEQKTIASTATYTDGNWHMAAATLSSAGMALYLDGVLVASDATTTAGQTYANDGYWSIGYGTLTGWTDVPSSFYFKGSMRYAAAYTIPLTAAQIRDIYAAGS